MKKALILGTALMFSVATVFAAVTIRYQNNDNRNHQFEARIDGQSKSVVFEASKTASVTIQGTATTAKINTSCGVVQVSDGQNILIKNGCITITTGR